MVRWPFAEREAWVREQLAMGMPVLVADKHNIKYILLDEYADEYCYIEKDGIEPFHSKAFFSHVITVLPALPASAHRKYAGIYYNYINCGLFPAFYERGGNQLDRSGITHLIAVDKADPAFFTMRAGRYDRAIEYLQKPQFNHAIDAEGKRHEIAVEGMDEIDDD